MRSTNNALDCQHINLSSDKGSSIIPNVGLSISSRSGERKRLQYQMPVC